MKQLERLSTQQAVAVLSVGKPVWVAHKDSLQIAKLTSESIAAINGGSYKIDTSDITGDTFTSYLSECSCYTTVEYLYEHIKTALDSRVKAANNILSIQKYFLDTHPNLCV